MNLKTDETWLDRWLDKHPKIDRLTWKYYELKRLPRRWVQNLQARREWRPGMYYLDHGSTPCVLVRIEDYDSLVGVSLVDGRIISGCSIYHCGPEATDEKAAWELAEHLRNCAKGEHQFEHFVALNICRYCDEPEGGWPEGGLMIDSLSEAWEAALKERTAAHGR